MREDDNLNLDGFERRQGELVRRYLNVVPSILDQANLAYPMLLAVVCKIH